MGVSDAVPQYSETKRLRNKMTRLCGFWKTRMVRKQSVKWRALCAIICSANEASHPRDNLNQYQRLVMSPLTLLQQVLYKLYTHLLPLLRRSFLSHPLPSRYFLVHWDPPEGYRLHTLLPFFLIRTLHAIQNTSLSFRDFGLLFLLLIRGPGFSEMFRKKPIDHHFPTQYAVRV